jgi:nucleoside-diphosphate-sugar epimerase
VALYLVTGASGFIGTALCARLRHQGHRVRGVMHTAATGPWHEVINCDLRTQTLPRQALSGIDGIYHCAGAAHFRGLSKAQQTALWQLNVDATERLLTSAGAADVRRLVYFSSVQAAGRPGAGCVDETWSSAPDNLYGESKLAAEKLVLQAGSHHAMHSCILRPTLVYGPGVKGNLQRMLRAIASGRMPPLPASDNRRSMVALENLIDAAGLAMNSDSANRRTYIACDDHPYSTRRLYEAMHQALDRPLPRLRVPLALFRLAALAGDVGNRFTDNAMAWDSAAYQRLFGNAWYTAARLKQELGWQPRVDFEQSLPDMVQALGGSAIGTPG